MIKKEECIKRYFNMWLSKDGSCLNEIFEFNVVYSECYGPEYRGIRQIIQWFDDWNERGTVIRWDIKQFIHQMNQTAVEWYFECEFAGQISRFDGVSIIVFNDNGKIIDIKEFQSKAEHEFPYGKL
ncbi:nuclear transport factor 2 family protein [Iocasia frigidifontis]|uniref:Nuclear transport factor 2 family protein n=1 Tax=Iocasia fonsfrigidae TaxID=2682810 RepID=A0A8A7KE10_9FIRM|nr:nuclear transport factor 2 family protein [Iocasia fonsfrigidae]QTL97868.1 nuclear transport factor 2 family protein [Iocasia fonsfrigidae]